MLPLRERLTELSENFPLSLTSSSHSEWYAKWRVALQLIGGLDKHALNDAAWLCLWKMAQRVPSNVAWAHGS